MQQIQIDSVLSEINVMRHVYIDRLGILQGDWFLFETSPFPSPEDLKQVIADIYSGSALTVMPNGSLRHSLNCKHSVHRIPVSVTDIFENLSKQKFRVALLEEHPHILYGQPIFIVVKPEISLIEFSDHPHLNSCMLKNNSVMPGYYLPDSICYTNNPKNLGIEAHIRIREAFIQVCIWLFSHQIWQRYNIHKRVIARLNSEFDKFSWDL